MDLFIIDRYRDINENFHPIDQESQRLEKLKQKIAERKKAHATVKSSDVITLKEKDVDKVTDVVHQEHVEEVKSNTKTNIEITNKHNNQKPSHEFKILGTNEFEKKAKVQRVLPYWLSHPFNISMNLKELSCTVKDQVWLHETLQATLLNEGVTHLFPVQQEVIPFILGEHKMPHLFQPHDLCVSAPTGSGKTLSFVLPIIQILMNEVGSQVKALIVLPVQELAAQVAKVFKRYTAKTRLRVALLGGSVSLQQEQQRIVSYTESSGWTSEVDIIICTAGRLVEHLQNTEGFSLKHLKFLVIDEADRIMEHIQNDWLYHVDKSIKLETELMTGKATNLSWHNLNKPKIPPHKLLFSATLSQDPEKLEQWGMFQPKLFSAAPTNQFEDEDKIRLYTTPAELEEHFISCEAGNKPLVLYHLLVNKKWDKVLCFTNASESAHRLTVLLKAWGKGVLQVAELSATLDRATREAVLRKFTQSEINVLISTDALARGIDIPTCNYVISYDPPRNIKTYIHRVGRTGRAGKNGQAVTILLPNQTNQFKDLIKCSGKSELPRITVESDIFESLLQSYERAINETKNLINVEKDSKVMKSIKIKRRYKSIPLKRKQDS